MMSDAGVSVEVARKVFLRNYDRRLLNVEPGPARDQMKASRAEVAQLNGTPLFDKVIADKVGLESGVGMDVYRPMLAFVAVGSQIPRINVRQWPMSLYEGVHKYDTGGAIENLFSVPLQAQLLTSTEKEEIRDKDYKQRCEYFYDKLPSEWR